MKRWKVIVGSLAIVLYGIIGLGAEIVHAENDNHTYAQDIKIQSGYSSLIEVDLGTTDEYVDAVSADYNRYMASKWNVYGSDYFYEQLSVSQKSLYQSLYNVCMNYMTTNGNAEAYNYATGFSAKVLLPSGMQKEKAGDILLLFSTNNPQFYFINEYYGSGTAMNGAYIQIGIYKNWIEGKNRTVATNQIYKKVNDWKAQIDKEITMLKKEQKAHDLVVTNTEYISSNYDQSSASVFLEGKAVCAGYAEAFAMLCNSVNIDTISLTSLEHEWNMVYLYGNWYNVDCTWDDTDPGFTYNFFNKSDRTIQAMGSHDVEQRWEGFQIPTASSDVVSTVNTIYEGIDYKAVLDLDYYWNRHPDLKSIFKPDSEELLQHFVVNGMREGRQGSANFNVNSYKNQYADLRNAYGNDLKLYYLHYIYNGSKEGRVGIGCTLLQGAATVYEGVNYSAVYDYNYYIGKYADVKNAYPGNDLAVLQHFINDGMREGRQGKNTFSVYSYQNQYVDLRNAFGKNLKSYYMHYMYNGQKEGRQGTGCKSLQGAVTTYEGVNYSAVYDYNSYINSYADIKQAYAGNDLAVLQHFINDGMREGRQGKIEFNVLKYKGKYLDLVQAFGTDLKAYYLHYIYNGVVEGRSAV